MTPFHRMAQMCQRCDGDGDVGSAMKEPEMEDLKFIMKIVVFGAVLGGIAYGLIMITLAGPVLLGG